MKRKNEESEQDLAKRFRKIQMIAFIFLIAIIVVLTTASRGKISSERLAGYASGNILRSVAVIILLFAIKSLTIFVPLAPLYIANGLIFKPLSAVFVSFLGLAIAFTLPYLLGRWSGPDAIDYVQKKYPNIQKALEIQRKNEFVSCFMIRIIGWIPSDILSFYYGACQSKYPVYMAASLCGYAIDLISTTLLGDAMIDPLSLQFLALIGIKLIISACAIFIAVKMNRSKKTSFSIENKHSKMPIIKIKGRR